MDAQLEGKYTALKARLAELGSVVVCLSGGVDSALLTRVAHDVLGDASLAVTLDLCSVPERDIEEARELAAAIGIEHMVVCINELTEVPGFAENPPNRCYLCKRELLTRVWEVARARGFAQVIEGSNADDGFAWRPGMKAVEELGVASPLADAGLTKAEVRELARELGLWVWDKPSAPCLATRIPFGTRITADALEAIGQAEELLHGLGFPTARVRAHGDLARIEVSRDEIPQLIHELQAPRAQDAFHKLGFAYVTVDPLGYRPIEA